MYNTVIRKAKESYENSIFQADNTNKILWNQIKKLTNDRKSDSVMKIKINDTYITANEQISNKMNDYFSKVGENLESQIDKYEDDCVETICPINWIEIFF